MRAERLVLLSTVLLVSCRDAGSSLFPSTPLGELGVAWLAAHNRAEGHAMVHFTMVNRGTAPMNGAQTDSAVYAGVKLAQELGPLVPIKLLYASDTSVTILLRSANRGMWRAEFTSAVQPSLVKVRVRMDPSS
jgi:hypothetical protein